MDGFDDMEERPMKVVGRRRVIRNPLRLEGHGKKEAEAWSRAFPLRSIPKGVHRFRSHEEADEWLWRMITRPRKS